MCRVEIRLAVDPLALFEFFQCAPAGGLQRAIDNLTRCHVEARVFRANAFGKRADDVMIGAAFAGGRNQLGAEHDVVLAAALIDVVMLDKHGGWQHDVCHFRGGGQELLVDAGEQILAGESGFDLGLLGRDLHGVHVLDEHRRDWWTVAKIDLVASEDWADAGHVKDADGCVFDVEAFDEGLVPMVDRAIGMGMRRRLRIATNQAPRRWTGPHAYCACHCAGA